MVNYNYNYNRCGEVFAKLSTFYKFCRICNLVFTLKTLNLKIYAEMLT